MSFGFLKLFKGSGYRKSQREQSAYEILGEPLSTQDTRAAIDELSKVVQTDSEAVEIYLALGSLYRSQGEIERAIQIRNNLIVRPGLDSRFKARAWYELGRDFRRGGFLDRSAKAFEMARDLGGEIPGIILEEARLAAQSNRYKKAADLYGKLNRHLAQAHYLVQEAREFLVKNDHNQSSRLVKQALKVYPASVEAWLEILSEAYRNGDEEGHLKALQSGLNLVEPGMRFLLLEGIMNDIKNVSAVVDPSADSSGGFILHEDMRRIVITALEIQPPNALLSYYGAMVLLNCHSPALAQSWLEKALLDEPDFWLAQLELFNLSKRDQTLSAGFRNQLDYFIDSARGVRRFVCSRCGLKQENIFFACPRCRSWHSITFRTKFTH